MRPCTRRQVIHGLARGALSAAGLPWLASCRHGASSAQQPEQGYRIGMLNAGLDVRGQGPDPAIDGLQLALAALGYTEGRNLTTEWRFSEGINDRLAPAAVELVQLPVALIVAQGAVAVAAAMTATRTIPIVMAPATDPVEQGLITSFARPGGNVTGYADLGRQLAVARLQILKQTLAALSRLDLVYPANPVLLDEAQAVEAAAPTFGVEVRRLVASTPSELDAMFAATATDATDAIMTLSATFITSNRDRIVAWAGTRRAPLSGQNRLWAVSGALLTYGVDMGERNERVAATIDKLLKGANPAVLPVEQPTRFELVINLQTARALGLTIPPSVLAQATEIIQ